MTEYRSLNELISLKGKRALVTGSAAGIGKAIASRFAEAGADLDLVDINGRHLITAKNELERFGTDIKIHVADLSKSKEIVKLWENLKGYSPDILVNNAGIYPFKHFLHVNEAFYQRVMETNLHSVFWMCQRMISKRLKLGGSHYQCCVNRGGITIQGRHGSLQRKQSGGDRPN